MTQNIGENQNTVYKLVLTGGPCGGKTTAQSRLCTFFENLGWKVFRVPETANLLLSGGVKFGELNAEQVYKFQEDLIKVMMQIEETYFALASSQSKDTIVICDRGAMDPSAFIDPQVWEKMMKENNWNEVDLRDTRYNQIIHLVSASKGAEDFYTLEEHTSRSEPLDLARALDDKASQAWVGHPYFDVVDNSTDFEVKLNRVIKSVSSRLGIDTGDRFAPNAKKRKFHIKFLPDDYQIVCPLRMNGGNSNSYPHSLNGLVNGHMNGFKRFPQFQDFIVIHDYLVTPSRSTQARIRKRGQYGKWSYTHTIRRPEIHGQQVELKMQVSSRDYENLYAQKDKHHSTIHKIRRCFLWKSHYFQMDIYQKPCPKKCEGLIILETYTTNLDANLPLPNFLDIEKEVTGDPSYSMYNLSTIAESPGESSLRRSSITQTDEVVDTATTNTNGTL